MPVVRVSCWKEYLTDEMKRNIAEEVTDSVARNLGCSKNLVTLVFDSVPMENWATGGKLASESTGDSGEAPNIAGS